MSDGDSIPWSVFWELREKHYLFTLHEVNVMSRLTDFFKCVLQSEIDPSESKTKLHEMLDSNGKIISETAFLSKFSWPSQSEGSQKMIRSSYKQGIELLNARKLNTE